MPSGAPFLIGWDGGGVNKSHIWFSPLFLACSRVEAPACIWEVNDGIVTRTYKPEYRRPSGLPNPPPMFWRLTDQYTLCGYRLGVWPD